MHLEMLSIFGFVHLAAGPVRPASESTGVFRNSGLQLRMLWVCGLLHLAAGPIRAAVERKVSWGKRDGVQAGA